jgi:hypothetical protein
MSRTGKKLAPDYSDCEENENSKDNRVPEGEELRMLVDH